MEAIDLDEQTNGDTGTEKEIKKKKESKILLICSVINRYRVKRRWKRKKQMKKERKLEHLVNWSHTVRVMSKK